MPYFIATPTAMCSMFFDWCRVLQFRFTANTTFLRSPYRASCIWRDYNVIRVGVAFSAGGIDFGLGKRERVISNKRMQNRVLVRIAIGFEGKKRLSVYLRVFFKAENDCQGMPTWETLRLPIVAAAWLIAEVDKIILLGNR